MVFAHFAQIIIIIILACEYALLDLIYFSYSLPIYFSYELSSDEDVKYSQFVNFL